MAKLRHITLSVDDMEKTAAFYEQAFEMKRVRQSGVAIMMSDGVVSLAIIDANKNANSGARKGLHHMGFLVDDINEAAAKVEKRRRHLRRPDQEHRRRPAHGAQIHRSRWHAIRRRHAGACTQGLVHPRIELASCIRRTPATGGLQYA